jgi:hypothetical protein
MFEQVNFQGMGMFNNFTHSYNILYITIQVRTSHSNPADHAMEAEL